MESSFELLLVQKLPTLVTFGLKTADLSYILFKTGPVELPLVQKWPT